MQKILLFAITALLLASCTEEIELELDDTYTRVVIEGSITNEARKHQVFISKTSPYLSNEEAGKVSGANVTISDGENTFVLTEKAGSPGVYETGPDVKGEAGKTYTLQIDDVEIDGEKKSFTAKSVLNPVGPIDSIQLMPMEQWGVTTVNVYAQEPPTRDFYMFKVYVNDVLYSDTLSEIVVQADDFFNGGYTNGIICQVVENNHLNDGDKVTFEIAGITEEYFVFILELQSETGFTNPLFSGPPANIKTNISNGGIGFFTAYSVNKASKIYKK